MASEKITEDDEAIDKTGKPTNLVVKLTVPKHGKTTPSIVHTTTLKPVTWNQFTVLESTNTSIYIQQQSSAEMNEDDEIISETAPNLMIQPTNAVVKLKIPKKHKTTSSILHTTTFMPASITWNQQATNTSIPTQLSSENINIDIDNKAITQTKSNITIKPTNSVVKLKIPKKHKTTTPSILHTTSLKPVSIDWNPKEVTHERFTPFQLTNAPIKVPFEETARISDLTSATSSTLISSPPLVSNNKVEVTSIVVDHDEDEQDYGSDMEKVNETQNDLFLKTPSNNSIITDLESTLEFENLLTMSDAHNTSAPNLIDNFPGSKNQEMVTHEITTQKNETVKNLATFEITASLTSEEISESTVLDNFTKYSIIMEPTEITPTILVLPSSTVSEKTLDKTLEDTLEYTFSTATSEFEDVTTTALDILAKSSIVMELTETTTQNSLLLPSSITSTETIDKTLESNTEDVATTASNNLAISITISPSGATTHPTSTILVDKTSIQKSSAMSDEFGVIATVALDNLPKSSIPPTETSAHTIIFLPTSEKAVAKTLHQIMSTVSSTTLASDEFGAVATIDLDQLTESSIATVPTETVTYTTLLPSSTTSGKTETSSVGMKNQSLVPTPPHVDKSTNATYGPFDEKTKTPVGPNVPSANSNIFETTTSSASKESETPRSVITLDIKSLTPLLTKYIITTSHMPGISESATTLQTIEEDTDVDVLEKAVNKTLFKNMKTVKDNYSGVSSTEVLTSPVFSVFTQNPNTVSSVKLFTLETTTGPETFSKEMKITAESAGAPWITPEIPETGLEHMLASFSTVPQELPEITTSDELLQTTNTATLEGLIVSAQGPHTAIEGLQGSQEPMFTFSITTEAVSEVQALDIKTTSEELPQATNWATIEGLTVSAQEPQPFEIQATSEEQLQATNVATIEGLTVSTQEPQPFEIQATSEEQLQATNVATIEGLTVSTQEPQPFEIQATSEEQLQATNVATIEDLIVSTQEPQPFEIQATSEEQLEATNLATIESLTVSTQKPQPFEIQATSEEQLQATNVATLEGLTVSTQEPQPFEIQATSKEQLQATNVATPEGLTVSTQEPRPFEIQETSEEQLQATNVATIEGLTLLTQEPQPFEIQATSEEQLQATNVATIEGLTVSTQEPQPFEIQATSKEQLQATNVATIEGLTVSTQEPQPFEIQATSEEQLQAINVATIEGLTVSTQEPQPFEIQATSEEQLQATNVATLESLTVSTQEPQAAPEILEPSTEIKFTYSITTEAVYQGQPPEITTSEAPLQATSNVTFEGVTVSTQEPQITPEFSQASEETTFAFSITSEAVSLESQPSEIKVTSEKPLQATDDITLEGVTVSTQETQITPELPQASQETTFAFSITSEAVSQEGQPPEIKVTSEKLLQVTNDVTVEGVTVLTQEPQITPEGSQANEETMFGSSTTSEAVPQEGQPPEIKATYGEPLQATNDVTLEGVTVSTQEPQITPELSQASRESTLASLITSEAVSQEGQPPELTTTSEESPQDTYDVTHEGVTVSTHEPQITPEVSSQASEETMFRSSTTAEAVTKEGQPEITATSEESLQASNTVTLESMTASTQEPQITTEDSQASEESVFGPLTTSEAVTQVGQPPEITVTSEEPLQTSNAVTLESLTASTQEPQITSEVSQASEETMFGSSTTSEAITQEGQPPEIIATSKQTPQASHGVTVEGVTASTQEPQITLEDSQASEETMIGFLTTEKVSQESQPLEITAASEESLQASHAATLEGLTASTQEPQITPADSQTSEETMFGSSTTSEEVSQEGQPLQITAASEEPLQASHAATLEGLTASTQQPQITPEDSQASEETMFGSLTTSETVTQEGQPLEITATSEEPLQATHAETLESLTASTQQPQITPEDLQPSEETKFGSLTTSEAITQEGQLLVITATSEEPLQASHEATFKGSTASTQEPQITSEVSHASEETMFGSSTAAEAVTQEGQPPEITATSEQPLQASHRVTVEGVTASTQESQITPEDSQASEETMFGSSTTSEEVSQEGQPSEITATSEEPLQASHAAILEGLTASTQQPQITPEVSQASEETMFGYSTAAEAVTREDQPLEVSATSEASLQASHEATVKGLTASTQEPQITLEVLQESEETVFASLTTAEAVTQEGQPLEITATSEEPLQASNTVTLESLTASTQESQITSEVSQASEETMLESSTTSEEVSQEGQLSEITATSEEPLQASHAAILEGLTASTQQPQITPEDSQATSEAVTQEGQPTEITATSEQSLQASHRVTVEGVTASTQESQITPEDSQASEETMFGSSTTSERVSQEGQPLEITAASEEPLQASHAATLEGLTASTQQPQITPEDSQASEETMFGSSTTSEAVNQEGHRLEITATSEKPLQASNAVTLESLTASTQEPQITPEVSQPSEETMFGSLTTSEAVTQEGQPLEITATSEQPLQASNAVTLESLTASTQESQITPEVSQASEETMFGSSTTSEEVSQEGQPSEITATSEEPLQASHAATLEGLTASTQQPQITPEDSQASEETMFVSSTTSEAVTQEGQPPEITATSEQPLPASHRVTVEGVTASTQEPQITPEDSQASEETMFGSSTTSEGVSQEGQPLEITATSEEPLQTSHATTLEGLTSSTQQPQITPEDSQASEETMFESSTTSEAVTQEGQRLEITATSEQPLEASNAVTLESLTASTHESQIIPEVSQASEETMFGSSTISEGVSQEGQPLEITAASEPLQAFNATTLEGLTASTQQSQITPEDSEASEETMFGSSATSEAVTQEGQPPDITATSEQPLQSSYGVTVEGVTASTQEPQITPEDLQASEETMVGSSTTSEEVTQEGQPPEITAASEEPLQASNAVTLESLTASTQESLITSEVSQAAEETIYGSSTTAEAVTQESQPPETTATSEQPLQASHGVTVEGVTVSTQEPQITSEDSQTSKETIFESSTTAEAVTQEGQPPETTATSEQPLQASHWVTVESVTVSTQEPQITPEESQASEETMFGSLTTSEKVSQEGQPFEITAASKEPLQDSHAATLGGLTASTQEAQITPEDSQASEETMFVSSTTAEAVTQEGQPPEITATSEEPLQSSNAVTLVELTVSRQEPQITLDVSQASKETIFGSSATSEAVSQEGLSPEIKTTSEELLQTTNVGTLEGLTVSTQKPQASEISQSNEETMFASSITSIAVSQEGQFLENKRTSEEPLQASNAVTFENLTLSAQKPQTAPEISQTRHEIAFTSSITSEAVSQEGHPLETEASIDELPHVTESAILEAATPSTEVLLTTFSHASENSLQVTHTSTIESATISSQENVLKTSAAASEMMSVESPLSEGKVTSEELQHVTNAATLESATMAAEVPQTTSEFLETSEENVSAPFLTASETRLQESQPSESITSEKLQHVTNAATSLKISQISSQLQNTSPENMISSLVVSDNIVHDVFPPEVKITTEELSQFKNSTTLETATVSTETAEISLGFSQHSPGNMLTTPLLSNTAVVTLATDYLSNVSENLVSFISTDALEVATSPVEITSENSEVSSQTIEAEIKNKESSLNTESVITNMEPLSLPTIIVLKNITLPPVEISEYSAETSQLQNLNMSAVSQIKTDIFSLPTSITSTTYEIPLSSVFGVITLSTETTSESLNFSLPTTEGMLPHSSKPSSAVEPSSSIKPLQSTQLHEIENKSSFHTSQLVTIANSSETKALHSSSTRTVETLSTVNINTTDMNELELAFYSLQTDQSVDELLDMENTLATTSKATQETFGITSSIKTTELSKSSDLTELSSSEIKNLLNNNTTVESINSHNESLIEEPKHSSNYKETTSSFNMGKEDELINATTAKSTTEDNLHHFKSLKSTIINEATAQNIHKHKEITDSDTTTRRPAIEILDEELKHFPNHEKSTLCEICNATEIVGEDTFTTPSHLLSTHVAHEHTEVVEDRISAAKSSKEAMVITTLQPSHPLSTHVPHEHTEVVEGRISTAKSSKEAMVITTLNPSTHVIPHKHTEVTENSISSVEPLEEVMDEHLKHFPAHEKSTLCEICNKTEIVGKASTTDSLKLSHSHTTNKEETYFSVNIGSTETSAGEITIKSTNEEEKHLSTHETASELTGEDEKHSFVHTDSTETSAGEITIDATHEEGKHFSSNKGLTETSATETVGPSNLNHSSVTQELKTPEDEKLSSTEAQHQKEDTEDHASSEKSSKEFEDEELHSSSSNEKLRKKTSSTETANETSITNLPGAETQNTLVVIPSNELLTEKSTLSFGEITVALTGKEGKHTPKHESSTNEEINEFSLHEGSTFANELTVVATNEETHYSSTPEGSTKVIIDEITNEEWQHSLHHEALAERSTNKVNIEVTSEGKNDSLTHGDSVSETTNEEGKHVSVHKEISIEPINEGQQFSIHGTVTKTASELTGKENHSSAHHEGLVETSTGKITAEGTNGTEKHASIYEGLSETSASEITIEATNEEGNHFLTHGTVGELTSEEEKHSFVHISSTKTIAELTGEEEKLSSGHIGSTETYAGEISIEATNKEGNHSSLHEEVTKPTGELTGDEQKHSSIRIGSTEQSIGDIITGATNEEETHFSIHVTVTKAPNEITVQEGKHYSGHEGLAETSAAEATNEEGKHASIHEGPAETSAGEITAENTNKERKYTSTHETVTNAGNELTGEEEKHSPGHEGATETTNEEGTNSSAHEGAPKTASELINGERKHSSVHEGLAEASTEIFNINSNYEESKFANVTRSSTPLSQYITYNADNQEASLQSLSTSNVTSQNELSEPDAMSSPLDEAHLSKSPKKQTSESLQETYSYNPAEVSLTSEAHNGTTSTPIHIDLPVYPKNSTASLDSFEKYYSSTITTTAPIASTASTASTTLTAPIDSGASMVIVDDEATDCVLDKEAFRAMKLEDFELITEFPPTTISTEAVGTCALSGKLGTTSTTKPITNQGQELEKTQSTGKIKEGTGVPQHEAATYSAQSVYHSQTEMESHFTEPPEGSSFPSEHMLLNSTSSTISEKVKEGSGLPQNEAETSTYSAHWVYNGQNETGSQFTELSESSSFHSEYMHSNGTSSTLSEKVKEGNGLPQKGETSTYSAHSVYNGQSEMESNITEVLEGLSLHTEHSGLSSTENTTISGTSEYLHSKETDLLQTSTTMESVSDSTHLANSTSSGTKYPQLHISEYPKMQEESTCKLTDFESQNYCICSIDNMVKDLRIKFSHSSPEVNLFNYTCPILTHIETGIILGNSSIPQVSRRHSGMRGSSIRKREIIDNPNIDKTLNQQLELKGKENEIFATPGMKLRIPCMEGSSMEVFENIVNYTWTFSDNLPLTEGKVQENEGALIIDYISAQDGGNYTCTVISGSGDSKTQKKFEHHISVVTLPTYTISTTILYNSTEKCQAGDADILSLYFPNVLGSFICGSYFPVCNLEIKDAQCVNKSEDYISANISTLVEPMNVIMPTLNTSACDVSCEMNMYTRIVLFIIKNLETIEKLPVFFRLAYRQQKLVPTERIVKKNKNEIGTEAPKLVIACPPGFGYHKKTHICGACERNSYSRGDETFCTLCPAGQYQPMVGSKSCLICSSPLQDPFCLRVVYSNSNKFRIVIGVSASILIVIFILLLFCLRSPKPASSSENAKIGREEYLKSKRHSKRRSRDVDVEKQEDAEPLLTDKHRSRKHKSNKKPPEPPPPDFF